MNAIVQELARIQERVGYLPEAELRALSERIQEPLHRLHEVVSFFPHFSMSPPAQAELRVCQDLACQLKGAQGIIERLKKEAAKTEFPVTVGGTSCLGRCDRPCATQLTVHKGGGHGHTHYYIGRSETGLQEVLRSVGAGKVPPADLDVSFPDTSGKWHVDPYAGKPTYAMARRLAQALTAPGDDAPAEARAKLLGRLEEAGLLGMGGAGGRVYLKWQDVFNAPGTTKYVICNADESEPGTFKDRELLLRTPHLTLEGMILGGLMVGAQRGYVYIRHEYEEQIARVKLAIEEAKAAGACGENIFGTELSFSLEVFVSPGGYICGEQTALIEAMEGKRAEPRNRPPEIQVNGLWDCPTLVNNVESFAWVPAILHNDADIWKMEGGFKGRRFFSISGDLEAPGVFEVTNGTTFGELIALAGGVSGGRQLKAVAASGPSGGFLPRWIPIDAISAGYRAKAGLPEGATHFDLMDWKLDIGVSRQMGLMLGAGITVYAEGTNMVNEARAASKFYRRESCGKCVPCRVGTQRLVEVYDDLDSGQLQLAELYGADAPSRGHAIRELTHVMGDTAICGLGKIAANPLSTLLEMFRPDVEEYLANRRGPGVKQAAKQGK